jgi:hypothetical protein
MDAARKVGGDDLKGTVRLSLEREFMESRRRGGSKFRNRRYEGKEYTAKWGDVKKALLELEAENKVVPKIVSAWLNFDALGYEDNSDISVQKVTSLAWKVLDNWSANQIHHKMVEMGWEDHYPA